MLIPFVLATFGKLNFAPATNCHPRKKEMEGRKEGTGAVGRWKGKVRYGRKNIKEIGCYLS